MRSHNVLVVGVGVLACVVVAGCGGDPGASPVAGLSPSSSITRLPRGERMPIGEVEAIFEQMLYCPLVSGKSDGFLSVVTWKHSDNASEAELQRVAFGWEVELEERDGPKDPDPQHPRAEYDQAVTADGLHFATEECAELGFGDEAGFDAFIVDVNGCLTADGLSVPIFGDRKSIAPSLRAGDRIVGGGGGIEMSAHLNRRDLTIPEECRDAGIDTLFLITAIDSVN